MIKVDILHSPKIETLPNGYRFEYDEDVFVNVHQIRKDRSGNLIAEVDFIIPKDNSRPLLGQKINLNSKTARKRLVKDITEDYAEFQDIAFSDIVDSLARNLIRLYREGNQAEEIWPDEDETLEVQYLLNPILYRNHPTVFFGDYGSCKSLLALVVAYIVQLPLFDHSLGFITEDDPSPCLYLDYEDDSKSFKKRWSAIERGLGKGAHPIRYKRMTAPLSDSVDQIQQEILDNNIRLLIVDSLGPAARGNLNDAEPAIVYHSALRQLGITSLTLAHTSKDQISKKKTIYGSIFFTNLSRSVWECKAEQEAGDNQTTISLENTKANLSGLHPTLGYKFGFSNNSIKVSTADLRETSLSGEMSLSAQILNLLRRGPLSVKEIAEKLEYSEASVRTTVNRLKDHLVKTGSTWGLKA